MDTLTIAEESPLGPDLQLLMARHTADMHAETPPESIHMLDAGQLARPGIRFFVMREGGTPVAMGAFKRLAGGGEIKSMHVLAEHRGRGLSQRMLAHIETCARADGLTRLWLETGVQPGFAGARRLYLGAGYACCDPFEGYGPDPNSCFMSKSLA